jgi:ketol-acid reductoisomerase
MLNDSPQEQLNYSMILLKHIDRISVLSTLVREDNPNLVNVSDDARAKAIFQSIYTLRALIPSSFKDELYHEDKKKEVERYLKQMDSLKEKGESVDNSQFEFYHRTCELNIIVDLLNRKGMLLSTQMSARTKSKKETSEVFE